MLFSLCAVQEASAQEKELTGIIMDSLDARPLDSALVTVRFKQQTITVYSNSKGLFYAYIPRAADSIKVTVFKKGFVGLERNLQLSQERTTIGKLILAPESKMMDDIIVRMRVPAISQRNDTTEYVVDSFERRRNAAIGDILKDLPGMEVDEEGNITHNGIPVTRILVNGEDYFGGLKEVALENLPAELVARLQVMDTKTREQIFNGQQGDGQSKTINIKLKSGLQVFGSGLVSAGSGGQLRGNSMLNVLREKKHIGLRANAHMNIRQGLNGQQLRSSTQSAGLHYRDQVTSQLNINSSFNINNNRSVNESQRQLQHFFKADSFFSNNSYQQSTSTYLGKQANVSMDYKVHDKLGLHFAANYNGGKSTSAFSSSNSISENGLLKNESARRGNTQSDMQDLSVTLQLEKRFSKKGRTFSLALRGSLRENDMDNFNDADNLYYTAGLPDSTFLLRQHIVSKGQNRNIGMKVVFTEPVAKNLRLQFSQDIVVSKSGNSRATYNVDTLSKTDRLDSTYSSNWSSGTANATSEFTVVYERDQLNVSAGLQYTSNSEQRTITKMDEVRQYQNSLNPTFGAQYHFSKKQSMRLNFSSRFQNPSIEQMQPVSDNSNPLYIRIGNPVLRPSFQQQYNLSYNNNFAEGRIFSLSLIFAPVSNSIVNTVYFDAYRRRIAQYVNVDGIYNISSNWNLTRAPNLSGGSSWGFSGNASYGRHVFFDNSNLLQTRQFMVRQTISYGKTWKKEKRSHRLTSSTTVSLNRAISPANTSGINSRNFSVSPRVDWLYKMATSTEAGIFYRANHNRLNYNVTLNNQTTFTDHEVNARIERDISKKIVLSSNFSYYFNGRLPSGSANRERWLLNMNASLRLFKNERGLLSVGAVDLLNQGAEISRSVGENFIEDVQSARQAGHYTISFQYNWVKASKKATLPNR